MLLRRICGWQHQTTAGLKLWFLSQVRKEWNIGILYHRRIALEVVSVDSA